MAEMTVTRNRTLVNPGRRREYRRKSNPRKLSPLQKLFFGTKRQRAAVAGNPSRRRTAKAHRMGSIKYRGKRGASAMRKAMRKYYSKGSVLRTNTRRRKRRNIGHIVTVWPNPSRRRRNAGPYSYRKTKKAIKKVLRESGAHKRRYKKSTYRSAMTSPSFRRPKRSNRGRKTIVINSGGSMARTRRRRRTNRSRRRRNPVYQGRIKKGGKPQRGQYLYTSNRGRRRRRHANPGRRRRGYRRNPGFDRGTLTSIGGILGGIAVTKVLSGFLPAMFSGPGIMGYLGVGAVAYLQGQVAGKVFKNQALGRNMTIGGLAYVAVRVLNDFFPSIGSSIGFSGMGVIGGSNFYTPQVNQAGNMGVFVPPAAIRGAVTAAMPVTRAGIGSVRRMGRIM